MTVLLKLKQATSEIALQGCTLVLDLTGAIYLPEHDVLLVADLHFEKGSSFALRGMMLPPYDTRETLKALCAAISQFNPRVVIALGDSFHDIGGPDRLGDDERSTLNEVQQGRDWIWVTGNHDRSLPPTIGGEVTDEIRIGVLTLRHEPVEGASSEVAGHFHPVGKVVMRGRSTRRRCFLTDETRCIMPALGAYAGGLNACDQVFNPLFPAGFTAHLIGSERIFAIARAMLCRD